MWSVTLDFNRKSSDHIESVYSLFVGVIANQKIIQSILITGLGHTSPTNLTKDSGNTHCLASFSMKSKWMTEGSLR